MSEMFADVREDGEEGSGSKDAMSRMYPTTLLQEEKEMKDLAVGSITFGVNQLESHFDAIRNRVTDALLFENMYYKSEYENEILRGEIEKLKKIIRGKKK